MDPSVREQVIAHYGKASAAQLARDFGITRNAVLGLWHRLVAKGDLPKRTTFVPVARRSVARPKPHLAAPVAVSEPGAPVVALPPPPPPPKGDPIPLLDVGYGQCRWMVSRTHCCGEPSGKHPSWCPEHHARVFTAVPARTVVKSPQRNATPPGFRLEGRVV